MSILRCIGSKEKLDENWPLLSLEGVDSANDQTSSFHRRFLPHLGSKEKIIGASNQRFYEEEKLLQILRNEQLRQELVDKLLELHEPKQVLKLRFLISYIEFTRTLNRKERLNKAKWIASTFFNESSWYYIEGLPKQYEIDVQRSRYQVFQRISRHLTTSLLESSRVYELVLES